MDCQAVLMEKKQEIVIIHSQNAQMLLLWQREAVNSNRNMGNYFGTVPNINKI